MSGTIPKGGRVTWHGHPLARRFGRPRPSCRHRAKLKTKTRVAVGLNGSRVQVLSVILAAGDGSMNQDTVA